MNLMGTVTKFVDWVKNNKLSTFLFIVLSYLVLSSGKVSRVSNNAMYPTVGSYTPSTSSRRLTDNYEGALPSTGGGALSSKSVSTQEQYQSAEIRNVSTENRRVVTDSSISLHVNSVRDTIEIIKSSAAELGGYMVDSHINSPEMAESGNITIRIPAEKLEEALDIYRKLAIKVVSENISGTDITDQYIDIEERITRLEETKARFDEIMDDATKVQDILEVQREIFYLQDQIDMYKGSLEYMDKASKTTLISIRLSTDELSLPYTPENAWRPEAVFKQATRDLLMTLITIGTFGIKLAVFTPLIIVVLGIFVGIKRFIKKVRG